HTALQCRMLVVGLLVAPSRIFELLAVGSHGVVSGYALERTFGGCGGWLEQLHSHVRFRKVVTRPTTVLIHADDIGRFREDLVLHPRNDLLLQVVLGDVVIGPFLVSWGLAHSDLRVSTICTYNGQARARLRAAGLVALVRAARRRWFPSRLTDPHREATPESPLRSWFARRWAASPLLGRSRGRA